MNEHYYLRLVELGPFERRPRGGWRFGTKVISDSIVNHLIARGHAIIVGNRLHAQIRGAPVSAPADIMSVRI